MNYILIWVLFYGTVHNTTSGSAEFYTQEACEQAKKVILSIAPYDQDQRSQAVCLPLYVDRPAPAPGKGTE